MGHYGVCLHKLRINALAAVAALAMLGISCARVPPPPYPLAFTLDAAAPRLLEASHEITVPVGLSNSGSRAWDPARIHLSYHWL